MVKTDSQNIRLKAAIRPETDAQLENQINRH